MRSAAKFLKGNCLGSCRHDRLPRCVGYWLTAEGCEELLPELRDELQVLADLDELTIARRLAAVEEALGFSDARLIMDAGRLWLHCKATGRYTTAIDERVIYPED